MNKAVHALVYVILAVAGVALYFEMKLSDKKELLKDSNAQLRDCIVKLSSYIEAEDASAAPGLEAKKDISAREAREVDDPDTENLLEDYSPEYETSDLKLMKWGDAQAAQLRQLYALDAEGNKQPDTANPGKFITKGKNTAHELIEIITDRASKQYEKLGKTRQALANVRGKLQKLVRDYNELPKEIRLNKIEIEKKNKELETLTKEKADVEDQLQKSQDEVKDLKNEVSSLKDEVTAAKDKTLEVTEALEKAKETIDNMKAILQKRTAEPRMATGPVTGGGQLTSGKKGTIVKVNNDKLYAVVKFDDAALDELIGTDRNGAMPPHEMLVVREDGQQKKIVAKIRLRQWTPKTNLVVADILLDWKQDDEVIKEGDVVRPD